MASPGELRRALTRRWPLLELVYLEGRLGTPAGGDEIESITMSFRDGILRTFGKTEEVVKLVVSPLMLRRDLGIEASADSLDREGTNRVQIQTEILRRSTPFVALLEDGRMTALVDRVRMASTLSIRALQSV